MKDRLYEVEARIRFMVQIRSGENIDEVATNCLPDVVTNADDPARIVILRKVNQMGELPDEYRGTLPYASEAVAVSDSRTCDEILIDNGSTGKPALRALK